MKWINDNSSAITALATLVLVFLTGLYVYLTRRMVLEMAKSHEADVTVDLELPDAMLCFVVANHGQSPARNIRFNVRKDLGWLSPNPGKKGIASLNVIRDGISYLPPRRTLRYEVGTVHSIKKDEPERVFSLEISYESNGQSATREVTIDFSQFGSVLFESYRSPMHGISKSLDDIRSEIQRLGKQSPLTLMTKMACPMCAEQIPVAAKKCSRCGELISSEPEA